MNSGAGIFDPGRRALTTAMTVFVGLTGVGALSVTTVMPIISEDLRGRALYAAAFSAPLAIAIPGMVAAGSWCDRRSARTALYAVTALLLAGLVLDAAAPSMPVFLGGRILQGFGTGGITVTLYVLVGARYPPASQPRILALFAAAWALPSVVAPPVAGGVAVLLGWRWVFVALLIVAVGSLSVLVLSLRTLPPTSAAPDREGSASAPGRLLAATGAAACILAMDAAVGLRGVLVWLVPLLAALGACAAVSLLVPRGTITARRGIPAVVLLRGLIAGSFFSAEVYVPYLLVQVHGEVPAVAGLSLAAAGLSWAAGSWAQGRLPRLGHAAALRLGSTVLAVALVLIAIAVVTSVPGPVVAGLWSLAGLGMGVMYPRTTVATLELSPAQRRGSSTSSLGVAEALGGGAVLALTGIGFAALRPASAPAAFVLCFAIAAAPAVVCVALAGRAGTPGSRRTDPRSAVR